MRKGKRYIPQSKRQYRKPAPVRMPKRTILNQDKDKTAYYRECLYLLSQTALFSAEQLLDSEISIHERMVIQKSKNELDKIHYGVMEQLSEDFQDLQHDRSHFLNEMIKLYTLVPPAYYEKMQSWMVEKIQNVNGIKNK